MYGPLRRLLDAVTQADPSANFIFAGDYVNRGPDSSRVIALLRELRDPCLRAFRILTA